MVVLSSIFIMPLSVPVLSNVVVVMHHDSATATAVHTLVENVPNVKVVDYDSLDYILVIHRAVRQVVWVSHGSEYGILTPHGMLSWNEFSHMIDRTPNRDLILACKSSEIYKYIDHSAALGFTGCVEATLGALVSSFVISGVIRSCALENTLDKLIRGIITPRILELTMLEFAWDTVNFMINLMFLGAGFLITDLIINTLIDMFCLLFIDTALIAGGVLAGQYTYLDLIMPLITLMLSIMVGLSILFPQYSALIAVQSAMLTTPFGYFLISVNIGVFAAQLYVDWLD
jgi:hypothetical protein